MKVNRVMSLLLSCSSLGWALPALAQEGPALGSGEEVQAQAEADDDKGGEDIIVTGTLLRGIAPVGSSTVGLNSKAIDASGAVSTNDLLTRIPQISNFGQKSSSGTNATTQNATGIGVNQYFQTTPPNLRDLLGNNAIGTTATLILLDGHRIVPVGTGGNAPDPDVIPPAALERVEIVLDGGSSLYGSDAIGGVINFITRRKYDGVGVRANYGFADDYWSYDANVIVGKDWGTGSAYITYNYTKSDSLFGNERDFINAIDWNTGVPTGRTCSPANVAVGTRTYAMPGLALGTINACDITDDQAIIPAEERHSVLASFNQDLSDWFNVDVKAFYTKREMHGNGGVVFPNGTTVTLRPGGTPATTPFYYRPLPGESATAAQTINFNYSPIVGNRHNERNSQIVEWGITPQVNIELGGRWQLRLMGNYGWSESQYKNPDVNIALQTQYAAGTTAATAINFYDLTATQNRALIDNVLNWQDSGFARSALGNARAVVDGPLIALPGGEVRVAAGAEYIHEDYKSRGGLTVTDGEDTLAFRHGKRHTEALFGEIFIPVFGAENAMPGFHQLDLSASVRHDRYSDFGGTTNPKFGATWAPFEGVQFRGSWAKSFNAPTLSQQLGSATNTITATNAFIVVPPNQTAPPAGSYNLTLLGSLPNLQPQTGESWSVGFDLLPTLVQGLRFTVNYYNVTFKGQLARAPVFDARLMFSEYVQYTDLTVTEADIEAAAAQVINGAAIRAQFLPFGQGKPFVYEILDYRLRNLGTTKLDGIDFSFGYVHDFDFGQVDFNLDGNYKLSREFAGNGVNFTKLDLDLESRLKLAAELGATIGKLRAQARWNHVAGYDVLRTVQQPQDKIKSLNTFDLYFRYDLTELVGVKDLAFSLNIDNVFDKDPPEYRYNGSAGYILGSPIGRMIRFGINAGF